MILVDFNGTIMHTKEAAEKVFQTFSIPWIRKQGFKGKVKEIKKAYRFAEKFMNNNEIETHTFAIKVCEHLGIKISKDEGINQYKQFHDNYLKESKLVEGVEDGLKELSKIDKLVLFSNGDDYFVLMALEKYNLTSYFNKFFCMGKMGIRKKEGGGFSEMKKLGAWAIIGDRPESDGVGEKFGIKFFDVRKGWDKVVEEAKAYYSKK